MEICGLNISYWTVSMESRRDQIHSGDWKGLLNVMQTVTGKEHTNEQTHRVEKPHKKL